MACALKKNGFNWTATVNTVVTVRIIADSSIVTSAQYNGHQIPVKNNSATFTVVPDTALLLFALSGPLEAVEVVEDCGNDTQHLFGYSDELHTTLGFTIMGKVSGANS